MKIQEAIQITTKQAKCKNLIRNHNNIISEFVHIQCQNPKSVAEKDLTTALFNTPKMNNRVTYITTNGNTPLNTATNEGNTSLSITKNDCDRSLNTNTSDCNASLNNTCISRPHTKNISTVIQNLVRDSAKFDDGIIDNLSPIVPKKLFTKCVSEPIRVHEDKWSFDIPTCTNNQSILPTYETIKPVFPTYETAAPVLTNHTQTVAPVLTTYPTAVLKNHTQTIPPILPQLSTQTESLQKHSEMIKKRLSVYGVGAIFSTKYHHNHHLHNHHPHNKLQTINEQRLLTKNKIIKPVFAQLHPDLPQFKKLPRLNTGLPQIQPISSQFPHSTQLSESPQLTQIQPISSQNKQLPRIVPKKCKLHIAPPKQYYDTLHQMYIVLLSIIINFVVYFVTKCIMNDYVQYYGLFVSYNEYYELYGLYLHYSFAFLSIFIVMIWLLYDYNEHKIFEILLCETYMILADYYNNNYHKFAQISIIKQTKHFEHYWTKIEKVLDDDKRIYKSMKYIYGKEQKCVEIRQ